MWVVPDESGIDPSYQQHEIDPKMLDDNLVTIASGIPTHDAAITLHNRHAALHGTRLGAGAAAHLPAAPYLHLSWPAAGSASKGSGSCTRATPCD